MPSLAALNNRFRQSIERLQYETEQGLIALRQHAHLVGLRSMQSIWGSVGELSLSAGIQDANRAKYYSGRLIGLAQQSLGSDNALAALDNRIATLAISENAQAFNQTRRFIANQLAEQFDLVEIWDAMLDACEVCWSMNGDEAPVGQGFPGGEEPGGVHPRCRCTSHFERRTFH